MLKTVLKTIVAIVVMLLLIVGAAVAYVKYSGENTAEPPAEEVTPPAATQALPEPQKPNPDAPVGASVQSLITPVVAGQNTSMTVKTNAESKCSIGIKYGEVVGEDSGLVTKVADRYGIVSWSWTVEESAPAGMWPVKVTCKFYKKSAYVEGYLKVTK